MDFIGIEVNHAVTQAVWQGLWQPLRFRPSWLQAQKVAAGHTGKKAGKGFYEYP
jgi:3-hydroxybutyryl-CoA dehydrogenase